MIEFTFTEEQELFRKAAREFAETQLAPHVAEMEKTGDVNQVVVQAMGEAGMMAITIPEEYGGLGLGYIERSDRFGRDQSRFCGGRHDVAGFCAGHRTHP